MCGRLLVGGTIVGIRQVLFCLTRHLVARPQHVHQDTQVTQANTNPTRIPYDQW